MKRVAMICLVTAARHTIVAGRLLPGASAFRSASSFGLRGGGSSANTLALTHLHSIADVQQIRAFPRRHYCGGCFSPIQRIPRPSTTRIKAESNEPGDGGDFEPTWTYVPYQPPKANGNGGGGGNRRRFSTSASEWTVPASIPIPEDQLTISFSRASGAGGQNVNKVETKVELRFHLDSASWIPSEVRQRLKSNESNRINSEGYMTVTSQEYRTQVQNRKDALRKLEEILRNSWARPKVRKMRKGLSKKAKENRLENKKKQSMKKEGRRRVDF